MNASPVRGPLQNQAAHVVISYPRRRGSPFAALTCAEFAVVDALLEGRAQSDIARLRGVSRRTVSNQLAAVYRKLGVSGAPALCRLALGAAALQSDEPAPMWTALVEGSWTLVERFDSDGRRFVVARHNAPRHRARHALTERERKVVALVAAGEPLKVAAHELGGATSTMCEALQRAMAKMGIPSRAVLSELHGAMKQRAQRLYAHSTVSLETAPRSTTSC